MSGFEPGDLIYRSKPFVYVLNNDIRGKRCDNCFMKRDGLKRCSQCSFVYFCNRSCQAEAWEIHKIECKYIKNVFPKQPTASLRLLANIIFKIKKFGLEEPSETIYGHKVNFRRLMSHANEIKQNLKVCQQMIALLGTLKSYLGESNIPSTSVFIEIFGKMAVNTFSICDREMQSIGCGMFLGASIFDHSCDPDAEVVFNGIELCIRAVKRISHTDVTQIYISYIEQLQLNQERQDFLREQYYFSCQCSRCSSSYYDELMSKTLIDKSAAEVQVASFKEEVDRIKQMKKDKVSATAIYEACLKELERQDGVLAETHILRLKLLELIFDACIENNQWADAITLGKELIEPYKLFYGTHPVVGIHLFKIGKIQKFQGLAESAKINLLQAEEILKVTHGSDHPLYRDLQEILHECGTFQMTPTLET